jgi:hypothetical protein
MRGDSDDVTDVPRSVHVAGRTIGQTAGDPCSVGAVLTVSTWLLARLAGSRRAGVPLPEHGTARCERTSAAGGA